MVQSKHHALAREALLAALTAYTGITTADGAAPANNTLICADLIGENDFISNKTILIGSGDADDESSGALSFATLTGIITVTDAFSAQIKAGTLFRVLNISIGDLAAIKTQTDKIAGKMLFCMDFWSDPQEEIVMTDAQTTPGLPVVTIADLPATATIVRAIAMLKFRMVENTNVAENSLDKTAAQPIQVQSDELGTWRDAINFVDEQFKIAAETREGGDVLIGSIDIAVEVDENDGYDFQWLNAKAHLSNLQFNDVQTGLRIWYSV